MKKTILLLLGITALHCAQAQTSPIPSPTSVPQPSPSASAVDVEKLRQQVEALTQTVGTLQKQLDTEKQHWDNFKAPAATALAPMPRSAPNIATGGGTASSTIEQLQNDVDELKSAQRQTKTGMFNPDISAAVDFITSYSKKTNNVNFTPRDVELMVQSNIDQYAKAYIVFNAESELAPMEKRGLFEDTSVGVEEAAIQTTSLPWGLELITREPVRTPGDKSPAPTPSWNGNPTPQNTTSSRRAARRSGPSSRGGIPTTLSARLTAL